jgi:hypothetical protein
MDLWADLVPRLIDLKPHKCLLFFQRGFQTLFLYERSCLSTLSPVKVTSLLKVSYHAPIYLHYSLNQEYPSLIRRCQTLL